ncbi:MAG: MFS transporter [Acidimicrobiales bacterium]
MQSPVQVVMLLRPKTRVDLLVAAAFSSLVFTATPFLLTAVSEDYDVSLGVASLISTFQLGGFVVASWLVGRVLNPSRRLLVVAAVAAAVLNGLSAMTPWFSALLALRLLGGVSLAVITWLGWQEVFGDDDRMGDVAVVGPVMGIAGAPAASLLADQVGASAVFAMLAVLALAPLAVPAPSARLGSNAPDKADRTKPIPVTRVILACLGLITLGGSGVFVFAAAIGAEKVGLDPVVVSLAFSANAALGIPPARYRGHRPLSGLWLLGTATMAVVVTNVTVGALFWAAVAVWGFAFWAGVPGIFKLLAERSENPADRAGDAQSIMAAGRVGGPLLGALFIEKGSIETLGFVAAALIASAAITLVVVELTVPPRSRAGQE